MSNGAVMGFLGLLLFALPLLVAVMLWSGPGRTAGRLGAPKLPQKVLPLPEAAEILLAQLSKVNPDDDASGVKKLALNSALGHIFRSAGRHNEAVAHYAAARDQALLQQNDAVLAVARSSLGSAQLAAGRPLEAVNELSASYILMAPEGPTADSLNTVWSLANAKRDTGHVDEAIELYSEALKIADAIEETDTAVLLNDMGTAYQTRGDLSSALRIHKEALKHDKLQSASSSGDSALVVARASTYLHIGRALHDGGDISGASEYYEKALRALKTAGGKSSAARLVMAEVLTHFARVQRDAGQGFEVALDTMEQVEKLLSAEDVPTTIELGDALALKANILREMGRLDEAETDAERALEVFEHVSGGEDSPAVAVALNTLGVVIEDKQEPGRAAKLFARALSVNLQTVGLLHAETAVTYNNLGNAFQDVGNLEVAAQNYLKCLHIQRSMSEVGSPDVAMTLNNIGTVRVSQGLLDEAETLFAEAVTMGQTAGLPPGSPDQRSFVQNLDEVRALIQDSGNGVENDGRS